MENRDIPFVFTVHARSLTNGFTAKKIAALLIEEVIKVFGGHPTVEPQTVTLDNGAVLQTTFMSDWPVREDAQNYSWHVRYIFKVDVPVAV